MPTRLTASTNMPSRSNRSPPIRSIVILLAALVVGARGYPRWNQDLSDTPDRQQAPPSVSYDDFVGAEACRECHAAQYEQWSVSTHGQAGGPPSTDRLLTPFDGRELKFADAVVRPMTSEDGSRSFRVELEGGVTFLIAITGVIGGGHMVGGGTQGFVSAYPDGTLRFVPFDYSRSSGVWFCNTRDGWLPITESLSIRDCRDWPPSRVLGDAARMENCQSCHGSQIVIDYDPAVGGYQTRVKSLRINCESCHGPGARHIEMARAGQLGSSVDIGIKSFSTASTEASLELCFQCHAIKSVLEPGYLPGESLQSHYSLKLPVLASDPYLPDGRLRIFAYQLNHLASDCYLSGSMTCLDCHDAHSSGYRDIFGRPLDSRFSDDQCLSCHPSKSENPPAHTKHAIGSPGSRCVSCHMPYRQHPTLGDQIRFARSDHTIAIPRPGFDESIGTVSSCRQCHQDLSVADLERQTEEWYGALKPHRPLVDVLIQERQGRLEDASQLLVPEVRDPLAQMAALGRFVMRSTPDPDGLTPRARAALQQLATSNDIDVRAVALASLSILDGADPSSQRMLTDARAARGSDADDTRLRWVSALVIFASQRTDQDDLDGAIRMLQVGLGVMPDHAITLYELALSYMQAGDWTNAERYLGRTLTSTGTTPLNDWLVYPNRGRMLVNLGIARDRLSRPDEAAEAYREAIADDPGEAMAYYYLGTYHQRRRELEDAVRRYRQALELRPNLADAYFLLAVALRDLGRLDEAISALDDLIRLDPEQVQAVRLREELIRRREGR